MRMSSILVLASAGLISVACGSSAAEPDASEASDGQPKAPDAGCIESKYKTYYQDSDEDSYGDRNFVAVDCEPPAGFVENMQDCNDRNDRVHPGGTEVCDGLDNDCDPTTVEECPPNCVPYLYEGAPYLFCNTGRTHALAKVDCEALGMHVVRIDSMAEHVWLSEQRVVGFGGKATTWHGASDLVTEGTWVWPDGEEFWQGRSNGTAVGGLFTFWKGGEPNNNESGGENCGTLYDNASGSWDDRHCNQVHRFVCEQL